MASVSRFIDDHFRHFNAAALRDSAVSWNELLGAGGKMFMTLAGAMSTAEIGCSLGEMIRLGKVHAICCTGANLEEDLFNLVAHDHYVRVPHYRDLSPVEEKDLLDRKLCRVTDTCIPEDEAMRKIEGMLVERWKEADRSGERKAPHEFLYDMILEGDLAPHYQVDPANSWVVAAAEKRLPVFVPGWEDSTLGNVFAACCINGTISGSQVVKGGIDIMVELAAWYRDIAANHPVGFFQIGGGIAGDFPICVVPMLHCDLGETDVPVWSWFCQISDSTTSYGSYSGAVPNEKITWGKLELESPKFIIESDATIVAPLIFAYLLGW